MNETDLITTSRKLLNYINALDYYYLFLFYLYTPIIMLLILNKSSKCAL